MGKYFVDITEDAKKQLASIRKSGNKNSIKHYNRNSTLTKFFKLRKCEENIKSKTI